MNPLKPVDMSEVERLTVRTDRLEFEPVRDIIVVEELEDDLVTGGGLHLPGRLKKSKFTRARVVAVGPGVYQNGILVPCCVKPGDVVVLGDCQVMDVPGRGRPTYIVNHEAVVSIVHEKGEEN